MTKAELLTKVSEKVAQKVENVSKKQVAETVDALFDTLKEVLCSEDEAASRLSYPGFGTKTTSCNLFCKLSSRHLSWQIF